MCIKCAAVVVCPSLRPQKIGEQCLKDHSGRSAICLVSRHVTEILQGITPIPRLGRPLPVLSGKDLERVQIMTELRSKLNQYAYLKSHHESSGYFFIIFSLLIISFHVIYFTSFLNSSNISSLPCATATSNALCPLSSSSSGSTPIFSIALKAYRLERTAVCSTLYRRRSTAEKSTGWLCSQSTDFFHSGDSFHTSFSQS